MANERAKPVGVRIGGVLAPRGAVLILHCIMAMQDIRAQLVSTNLKQGPAHAAPVDHDIVLHGAKAARPRTDNGAHVKVLNSVIRRMGNEDTTRFQGKP